ncbi:4-hydroxybenzoate octaprenyltransferase [Alphaproteobacteria bacterium]|nr:4-hydroxybenzoate octaprenyltransferase [Alphaproteobacteria bacterium]
MTSAYQNDPKDQANIKPDQKVADASQDNWVDLYLPLGLRPYARLARLDRPIGTWLLFLPCLWGLLLTKPAGQIFPTLSSVALFAIGALVMRGAGCTINDIIDRNIDGKVERTANRPLPSGQVSLFQAFAFLAALLSVGLIILLQFNALTIYLGIASLALVVTYPFMKRITWWPQFFLGLTFNWGVLMGALSQSETMPIAALWLYAAGLFWTLGYDTIYAHQDREDDALVGVRSSALKLGQHTKLALYGFFTSMVICLVLAGVSAQLGILYWPGVGVIAWHLWRQIYELDINNPAICLALFKRNRDTGILIATSLLIGSLS